MVHVVRFFTNPLVDKRGNVNSTLFIDIYRRFSYEIHEDFYFFGGVSQLPSGELTVCN